MIGIDEAKESVSGKVTILKELWGKSLGFGCVTGSQSFKRTTDMV